MKTTYTLLREDGSAICKCRLDSFRRDAQTAGTKWRILKTKGITSKRMAHLIGVRMPIEAIQLIGQPVALSKCPKCEGPFDAEYLGPNEPFMRGLIQRSKYALPRIWRVRPYCAVICPHCKEIVDWETPFCDNSARTPVKQGPYRTSLSEDNGDEARLLLQKVDTGSSDFYGGLGKIMIASSSNGDLRKAFSFSETARLAFDGYINSWIGLRELYLKYPAR